MIIKSSFFEKDLKYEFKPLMKRYSLLKLDAYKGILDVLPLNSSKSKLDKMLFL